MDIFKLQLGDPLVLFVAALTVLLLVMREAKMASLMSVHGGQLTA